MAIVARESKGRRFESRRGRHIEHKNREALSFAVFVLPYYGNPAGGVMGK